ncbi:MAG: zinc-binding alcohol dehydrogenase [Armatimonadota bacterium]|nr:zinc-binding alcohol dehydrogenase [Armatimonadota bacterium]
MTVPARAVVFQEPGRITFEQLELPSPGEEDLVVRILRSAISPGTERWLLRGQYSPARFPLVPGYQSVGIVEHTGANVRGITPGDCVFVGTTRVQDGMHAWWGAHASAAVVHHARVLPIPWGLGLDEAALSPLAAVAHHGARILGIHRGMVAVVVGLGMVGQLVSQILGRLGATVIGSEPLKGRRDRTSVLGMRTVDPARENLEEVVRTVSPDGVDVVVECTGRTALLGDCLRLLRFGGTLSLQGYYPGDVAFPFEPAHRGEVTIKCPRGWPRADHEAALALMARGELQVGPLITHRLPAAEACRAYELLEKEPEGTLGVVLIWDE